MVVVSNGKFRTEKEDAMRKKKKINNMSAMLVLFLLVGIAKGEVIIRSIDGTGAYITNTPGVNWGRLYSGTNNYRLITKPANSTPGIVLPWILNNECIALQIDEESPADDSNLQKLYYEVMPGSSSQGVPVLNPNSRYVQFKVKFQSSYELSNDPFGTGIFQCWQGSGWPPLQARTQETNGQLGICFRMNNDNCRGGTNQYSSVLGTGTYTRNVWYTIKVYIVFDYDGNAGEIKVWKNGVLQFDWTGNVGYTPESVGGQVGTTDRTSVEFGMYQNQSDAFHRLYFDDIKYWD